MGLFNSIKDNVVSLIAEKIIQPKIKRYSDLKNLKLDSKNKRLKLKIILKGEDEIILVQIIEYEVVKKGEKYFFRINDAETSRLWLTYLIEDFFIGKEVEIPDDYGGIIKNII